MKPLLIYVGQWGGSHQGGCLQGGSLKVGSLKVGSLKVGSLKDGSLKWGSLQEVAFRVAIYGVDGFKSEIVKALDCYYYIVCTKIKTNTLKFINKHIKT